MDIKIITRHLDRSESLIQLAQRRAGFGALVSSIDIRVSDINGPRGGQGISCLARLRLADGGDVLVESSAISPEDGIIQAIAMLSSRLRRVVSRHHDHH